MKRSSALFLFVCAGIAFAQITPPSGGGTPGPQGPAGTVAVGTTTTGAGGTSASVNNTGPPQAAVLNFTIPQGTVGPTGATGSAATVSVGTTTTGAPGTSASVTNTGSSSAAIINFTVPQGATGAAGATGATGSTGATGPAGPVSSVTSSNAAISVANQTTAPVLTPVFGAATNTFAQGDDTRFPASVTGLRKGSGAGSADTAATAGTDYLTPFASQTANRVYASPNGSSGTPTFRALVLADSPAIAAYSLLSNSTAASAVPVAGQMLTLGTPGYTPGGGTFMQLTGSTNNYYQHSIQNTSNGASASTDYVVNADNATDSTNYADFGINGSAYSVGTWTINGAGDAYLYNQSNGLAIGTATAAKPLILFSGGTLATNERARISDSGLTVGTSGSPISQIRYYSQTLTPALVGAANCTEQSFTVTGLTTADDVKVTAQSGRVGVTTSASNPRVSAANTLAITFCNVDRLGANTPDSQTYTIRAERH